VNDDERCVERTIKGTRCRRRRFGPSDRCVQHQAHANPGGRPPMLSDELADTLVSMLRAGNYVGVATQAARISRATFGVWMRRGESSRPEDEPYRLLRERVEQARAEGEVRNVAQIARAAAESWQAAAWLLERQYPERWGRAPMAVRLDAKPEAEVEPTIDPDDPFAEVDELARARRRRGT
jgi:hypothetical protein